MVPAIRAGRIAGKIRAHRAERWDTASKASELSDFSVCTSWGILGKDLYLLDVLRRRMEYPELKRVVREQYARFRPSVVLIEDKASGTQLIQELVAEGLYAVTRYQPQSDKVMRMHAQTAMIENGFVHLPDSAPWLAAYLHEITTFPNGRHDDQVDSTAQMLDWFKQAGSGVPTTHAGIFEYYRQLAERLRQGDELAGPMVRLRAPAGVGAVQTLSRRHLNVANDGTVEMSETDAAPLVAAGWVRVDAACRNRKRFRPMIVGQQSSGSPARGRIGPVKIKRVTPRMQAVVAAYRPEGVTMRQVGAQFGKSAE